MAKFILSKKILVHFKRKNNDNATDLHDAIAFYELIVTLSFVQNFCTAIWEALHIILNYKVVIAKIIGA